MKARPILAVLAGLLLAAGCTNSSNPVSTSHKGALASPAPSMAAATPAAATPTPAPAPASCKLPVASGDAPIDGRKADGTAGHGGFVTIPGGTFSADPASLGTYDRAVSKWLPITRAAVSPDGTKYAWGEYPTAPGPATGSVHIVDSGSSADKTVAVPAPSTVVSYESAGVYVTRVVPNSGAPAQGLVLLDPTAGTFHQMVADGTWVAIGGGVAFGQDLDPAIAPPGAFAGPGAANRVRRLDLSTAAVTTVASFPGARVLVLGANVLSPVLAVTTGSSYTVSLGATTIFSGTPGPSAPAGPVVFDGGTMWFGSSSGAVWRWNGSGSATQVATASVSGLQVAGACR